MSKNCHFKLTYGGGSNTDRNTCLATELYRWSSISDCYNNDWLLDASNEQWTLTPRSHDSSVVFSVGDSGFVYIAPSHFMDLEVYPAAYLSSNVRISGGSGSSDDSFTLTIG